MIRRVSRNLPLVVLEHATEGFPADDSGDVRGVRPGTDRWRTRVDARPSWLSHQQPVAEPLVRALFVVMTEKLRDEEIEMPLAARDEVMQAFSSHRSDPTLRERVQLRQEASLQPCHHPASSTAGERARSGLTSRST